MNKTAFALYGFTLIAMAFAFPIHLDSALNQIPFHEWFRPAVQTQPIESTPVGIKPIQSTIQQFHDNTAFFLADKAREQYQPLNRLFTDIQISLECDRIHGGTKPVRQKENQLHCDGVSLTNQFVETEQKAIKQTIIVTNNTNKVQKRTVGIQFSTFSDRLETETSTIYPTREWQEIPSTKKKFRLENSDSNDFQPIEFETYHDATVSLITKRGRTMGRYDWSDFLKTGFEPKTIVYKLANQSVIETLIELDLQPNQTVTLDPVFDLNNGGTFTARWSAPSATDNLGFTGTSGPGVQLVNVDNGSYANDLLMTAINADLNGKTDVGGVYLVKNIDSLSGVKDLNITTNFDVRWNGGTASDQLGGTDNNSSGVQLVNADNGSYANDLLLTVTSADVNGKANSGAVYLIKGIDSLSGVKDLNSSTNFDVRWNGAAGADLLGLTNNSGSGVQFVNVDNGSYANDLLLTAYGADVDVLLNVGAVYLVKNINSLSGVKDLASPPNFDVRWNGGTAFDKLGNTNGSGSGVQFVNADNGAYANDLLITAVNAAVNGKINNGAVYLIKGIDSLSGVKDLNSSANFDVRFNGGSASDAIGSTLETTTTNGGGSGVQFVNVDNGAYANDLLITAANADLNAKTGTGAVYLVKNIDSLSGSKDFVNLTDYDVEWNGGTAAFLLGTTNNSGSGVILGNSDNGAYANDLLLTISLADVNGKTNDGAVYLIKGIDSLSGPRDLGLTTMFDVRWNGGEAGDNLGDTNASSPASQFVNVDNGSYANDLLLTVTSADVNGKANSGAVYLIKNIGAVSSGIKDLNNPINYDVRWNGGSANDFLGDTNDGGSGVQLVNVDNGAYANDILLTAIFADVNGKTNNGAVYLVKNVDSISGSKDLSDTTNFDDRWNGGEPNDLLGSSDRSGLGVQLVTLDEPNYSNDLVLTASFADVNSKTDVGAVYMIRNIDSLSGVKDLNITTNFDSRWNGNAASNQFGKTGINTLGASGVMSVNADNASYSNDVLFTAANADVNQKTNNGVITLILDIVADASAGIAGPTARTTFRWVVPTNKSVTVSYLGACSTTNFFFVEADANFDPDQDGNAWQIRPNSASGGGVGTKCQSSTFAPISIKNNGNVSFDLNAAFSTALDTNIWLKVFLGTGIGCGTSGVGGGDDNGMRGWRVNCALFAPTDFSTALSAATCRDFNSANSTMMVRLVASLLANDSNQLCFSGEFRGPAGDAQPAQVGGGNYAHDLNIGIPS